VRAVARFLGLDEENIVAEYAAAVGDQSSVPVWTGSPPAVPSDRPWLAWILAAVVAIALATGGWFGVRRIFAWRASRRAAQIAAAGATPSPEQTALPSPTEPVRVSGETAPALPSDSPNLPGSADSLLVPVAGSDSSAADVPFELKVEAGKATRVIVEADAHRVFEGTMKVGEDHTFTARDKIQISAGDAGALVLELNGKTLAPMGPPGHEGKATLTRESLKGTAGGGN
jgi:cytoskeletal protein RodZ